MCVSAARARLQQLLNVFEVPLCSCCRLGCSGFCPATCDCPIRLRLRRKRTSPFGVRPCIHILMSTARSGLEAEVWDELWAAAFPPNWLQEGDDEPAAPAVVECVLTRQNRVEIMRSRQLHHEGLYHAADPWRLSGVLVVAVAARRLRNGAADPQETLL